MAGDLETVPHPYGRCPGRRGERGRRDVDQRGRHPRVRAPGGGRGAALRDVPAVRGRFADVAVAAQPMAMPDEATSDLDEVGQLGLAAFALRVMPEYAEAKGQRPNDGEDWDDTDADAPAPPA